jgi:tetratricopeptide (TPR) repeat protein
MMSFRKLSAVLFVLSAVMACAQQPTTFNFVAPDASGRIVLPPGNDWQPQSIVPLDGGTRPVLTFKNKVSGIDLSVILFANHTGAPTSESCRDAAIHPILANLANSAVVRNVSKETRHQANGPALAVESYFIDRVGDMPLRQQNLFGFYGDQSVCAEIHISKPVYISSDAPQFENTLKLLRFDSGYQPTSHDYSTIGTIYFAAAQSFAAAAVYYQRALDTLSPAASNLNTRRFLTDQLSMSYGISGDMTRSRKVNEEAIAHDPDYPIYYYDLACADAEDGNADAARAHLQLAFDRRRNVLPGETFPDPATDDSFARLKDDKGFWDFVAQISAAANKDSKK